MHDIHPERAHELALGRSERSETPKLAFRDVVDVEKALALPIKEELIVDWSTIVKRWWMFLNDKLGDCTCASSANGVSIFKAAVGLPFTVTDADVLRMYERSGYKPGKPDTDRGWTLEAAAGYLRTIGLKGTPAAPKPDIVAYANVGLEDEDAAQIARELFGGCYIGAELPSSAQSQYQQGKPWTLTNGGHDAGTWGGHALWEAKTTLRKSALLETWEGLQEAREGWLHGYVDERMAFVPADWRTKMPERLVEAGIVDFNKLDSLLGQLTARKPWRSSFRWSSGAR
jgi:hypothetical protein